MEIFDNVFSLLNMVTVSLVTKSNPFCLLFFGFFVLGLVILILYLLGVQDNK